MLSRSEISDLLHHTPPLIEGMIDPDIQVGPNGVELTVSQVFALMSPGSLGFDNTDRRLARTVPLDFDNDGWLHLDPGCYKVVVNEIVNIPLDICALARPRSTLLRSGASVETALWDSGYHGRSEVLLVVHNRHGLRLRRDARIVQLVFFKLNEPIAHGYDGDYQGENV
jgi:dUTP pyrophosphatase